MAIANNKIIVISIVLTVMEIMITTIVFIIESSDLNQLLIKRVNNNNLEDHKPTQNNCHNHYYLITLDHQLIFKVKLVDLQNDQVHYFLVMRIIKRKKKNQYDSKQNDFEIEYLTFEFIFVVAD